MPTRPSPAAQPISIVVPAHNEEALIERCLRTLIAGARPGEIDVVVVCNACTDATEDLARGIGTPVRVISTSVASKSHALNLGDAHARGFPRFYVDAQVVLEMPAVRAVADELTSGVVLAAAPRLVPRTTACSWLVRAFYRVWMRLPYLQHGSVGSGVFALSQAGRERFDEFPALTGNDAYVRAQFASHERRTLPDCIFVVEAPGTVFDLMTVVTRAHFGNLELGSAHPELRRAADNGHAVALMRLARNPRHWIDIGAYVAIRSLARARALQKLKTRRDEYRQPDGSTHTLRERASSVVIGRHS